MILCESFLETVKVLYKEVVLYYETDLVSPSTPSMWVFQKVYGSFLLSSAYLIVNPEKVFLKILALILVRFLS